MELLVAWGLFPLLLTALALGCGLLVRTACGGASVPRALIPLAGLSLIVVVGQLLTLSDATAELTTPLAALLALAGLIAARAELARPPRWALLAAGGVFAAYAAPVLLSGAATFAGYIRLDDTATWMAFTDHLMEHGRDLDGLPASTYEAALAFNIGDGYPIGAFLPLGAGAELSGEDVAWLVQPYLAWLAALLSLALWELSRALIAPARWRAAAALIGAQAALLYGYAMWGGIKEIAAAALIAAAAGLLGSAAAERFSARSLAVLALVCSALVGVLSAGGVLWLLPLGAVGLVAAVRRLGVRAGAVRAGATAALVGALALPVIAAGPLPPTASPLDDPGAKGNLIAPLDPAQIAGVWPAGDFRLEPDAELLTAALIGAAVAGAVLGMRRALRVRAVGVLGYLAASLLGCAAIWLLGSPWVDAKALATGSPAIPFAALAGGGALLAGRRRLAGGLLVALVCGGVLASNLLAYRDVSLAPRDQLEELAAIGGRIDGEGPTLLTEYQPYGARHFLRAGDPEAVSELRRRPIPLLDGERVSKGHGADTDAIDPRALFAYRSLVLRRSPVQSRPPAAYRLRWRGAYYELWQRPSGAAVPPRRLALGNRFDPAATPRCSAVRRLSRRGEGAVAARAPARLVLPLRRAAMPEGWVATERSGAVVPGPAGSLEVPIRTARGGTYEVWLRGSVRPRAELSIDGEAVGQVRHELNNLGSYVSFGTVPLTRGRHLLRLELDGADLHPGSGGAASAVGPVVLSRGEAADAELVRFTRDEAGGLCRREWDWIEAAGQRRAGAAAGRG